MATVDYDICILGSGIAGLYCARELAKRWPDATFCIVEKYKFIGGRTVTFKKDIPKVGHLQWENGAGRIHKTHSHTLELCREYGLDVIPIPKGLQYREGPGQIEDVPFGQWMETYRPLAEINPTTLKKYTLKSLLERVEGPETTEALMDRYEYRSELDTLRADKGFFSIFGELGHQDNFFVMKDGFSAMVRALREDVESAGAKIIREFEVTDISRSGEIYRIHRKGAALLCNKVIVALHRDAVADLPCFRGHPLLTQVKMRPLVRMYAVFPKQSNGTVWFDGLSKFVCAKPVRYVIPMNPAQGTIMISYTDGADAEYWLAKLKDEKAIQREVLAQLRALFPEKVIPPPVFFKIHPWYDGCSYWTPGNYDIEKASWDACQPLPETLPGVWMCGESWNPCQCWVDSALNHAKRMLSRIH